MNNHGQKSYSNNLEGPKKWCALKNAQNSYGAMFFFSVFTHHTDSLF
jgi:hypothetical protein